MARVTTTESPVVHDCLEWLAKQRVFAWRNNTGAIVLDRRLIRYGHPGSSDILGILDDRFRCPESGRSLAGVLLCVECKSPTGRQSTDQKLFERIVSGRGGVYVLARSDTELADKLRRHRVA
jgi:hypothetical protein